MMSTRALALIDGEHYPAVVRSAFEELPYEITAAVFLGGTEKIGGGEDYGVPLHHDLEAALAEVPADIVLDLSDEPVVDPKRRFQLASRTLAAGIPYVGADFRFEPVAFAPFELPSLGIIGTGKRVGKTAVSGHVARLLAETREVVVVAMGRGGPPTPVLVSKPPTIDDLLELSRQGRHAASDYLEDAVLAGVPTVGCRRCGGGLAGQPFIPNVEAGARVAQSLAPDLVIFEGSGAAVPPIATDRRLLVVGAAQGAESVTEYLGAYRLFLSDLAVVTMCEAPLVTASAVTKLRKAMADVCPDLPVISTVLRPKPVSDISGRRTAFFSTAPEAIHDRLQEHLEQECGAQVVLVSGNLADRAALRLDLAGSAARSADLYLVEIKAAAIDVVAETAADRDIEAVFADNAVVPLDGEMDLNAFVLSLVPESRTAA